MLQVWRKLWDEADNSIEEDDGETVINVDHVDQLGLSEYSDSSDGDSESSDIEINRNENDDQEAGNVDEDDNKTNECCKSFVIS